MADKRAARENTMEWTGDEKWPEGRLAYVNPASVVSDDAYQRPVSMPRVRRMVKAFSRSMFFIPICGERDNGDLYVVDGHHRLIAAKLVGEALVPVLILHGSRAEIEAQLFSQQNERVAVCPGARFRAALLTGDSEAAEAARLMSENGLEMARTGSSAVRVIAAADTVIGILRAFGSDGLQWVLSIVSGVWDGERDAMSSTILRGLALFHQTFPEADDKRVRAVLGAVTAQDVYKEAQMSQRETGRYGGVSTVGGCVAKVIRGLYNHRRVGANRLDENRAVDSFFRGELRRVH